jgi:hypothetical protein
MKTKILIEVSGGIIQNIYGTDNNIEVTYIDWDNIDNNYQIDPLTENNYPTNYLDDEILQKKLMEANNIIYEKE